MLNALKQPMASSSSSVGGFSLPWEIGKPKLETSGGRKALVAENKKGDQEMQATKKPRLSEIQSRLDEYCLNLEAN